MKPLMTVEEYAQYLADECGRPWDECGAYERASFMDEARVLLAAYAEVICID